MRPRMKLIVAGSVTLCAMLIILAVAYFSTGSNKNSSSGSLRGENQSGDGTAGTVDAINEDPSVGNDDYVLHALAIGDWGSTMYKYGSCCNRYRQTAPNSQELYKDFWAQKNVAELLAQSAERLHPHVIISHGDNM